MKQVKVLYFVDRMRGGGIQMLLADLFAHFSEEDVRPELLLLDDGEHYDLEDKVRGLGIPVHKLNGIWLRKPQDYFKYCRTLKRFFQECHDYDAVHMNSGSKNYFVLKYAKRYGIPVRIAHAHNTGYQTKSKAQILLGELFKPKLRKYATHLLACSDFAGKWMFGEKTFSKGKVTVIPNGVDLQTFAFDEGIRERKRKELGISEDAIIVGNVGRFVEQKNHAFLIDIFERIRQKDGRAVLLLAGIGELREQAEKKVRESGLNHCVKFLGFRNDVSELLQAMDLFLMPSLYEGFPVTGVEAQASGLSCAFSDTITGEAKIIDEVEYIPLTESADVWAERCLSLIGKANRKESNQRLRDGHYDIRDMIQTLLNLYRGTQE